MMTKEKDKSQSSRFSQKKMKKQLHQSAVGDSVTREKPKKGRLIKRLSAVNKASSPNSITLGKKKKKKNHTDMSTGYDRQLPSPTLTPASTLSCAGNKKSKRFKLPIKLLDGCNGVGHSTVPRKLRSAMKKRSRESLSPTLTDPQKLLNRATDSEESLKGHDFKRSRLAQQQEYICGLITKDEEEVVESLYALAGNDNNVSGSLGQLKNVRLAASPSALKEQDSGALAPTLKEDSNSISRSRTDESANHTYNVCNNAEEAGICNGKILTEKFVKHGGEVNIDETPVTENHKPLSRSTNVSLPLEPALDAEKQKPVSKPDNWFLNPETGRQLNKQLPINIPKKNGLALWPELSNGASSHGSSKQCSLAKVPAWLDAAVSASNVGSSPNVSSFKKVSDKRPWKRSRTHVCISRLIQSLQTLEKKDKTEVETREMLKPAVFMTLNELQGIRKGFNGAANENRKANLQPRRCDYDEPHAGTYNSQEQSFNFMSFLQANASFNGSSKPRGSYLDQNIQHTTMVMPTFVHQPYPDQTQLQPTTYTGRPLYPPNLSNNTLSTQNQRQQAQIQQSQYLAAQLAARYRGAGGMTQLSSWHNTRQEMEPIMPSYVRAIIPRPPSSLKQQQQPSLQDHVLSSVFEDTGHGFRANLPLQLLCNERI